MADLNRRSAAKAAIQRIYNEASSTSFDIDPCAIDQKLISINGHFQRFLEAHQALIGDSAVDDIEHHQVLWDAVEQQYDAACVIMRRLLAQPLEPKPNPFESATSRVLETRLDPLAIPAFDGSQHKWLAFKDTFEALVHSQNYPDAYKLGKLRTAINPEVVPLVGGLYTGGYDEVWHALKRRYDNPRQLSEIHVTRFLNMECQPSETHSSLLRIVDTTRESLRALTVMNLPVQSWDALTVPIVASKLPVSTQRAWSMSRTTNAIPTLEELLSFVEKRALTLSSSSICVDKPRQLSPSWQRQRSSGNNPKVQTKINQTVRAHAATVKDSCHICGAVHGVFQCPVFREMAPSKRFEKLKGSNLCFNCLRLGHSAKACPSGTCRHCGGRHNTLLCTRHDSANNATGSHSAAGAVTRKVNPSSHTTFERTPSPPRNFMAASGCSTILATACVLITDAYGNQIRARALCDPGSQSSFIAEAMANRIGLPRRKCVIAVQGIGSTATSFTKGTVNLTIASIYPGEPAIELAALIIPNITSVLPTNRIDPTAWPHLPINGLADPAFHIPSTIDLLLGADIWGVLIQDGVIHGAQQEPHAQLTQLGWVVFGPVINDHLPPDKIMACMAHSVSEERLDTLLHQFWSWEEAGGPSQARDLDPCEQIFQDTHYRDENGQYVVQIPFDSQASALGDSFVIAQQQFLRLERKLNGDSELRQKYINFMREYQSLGDMQPADLTFEHSSPGYFIPHHAVSTKFRVVFNASAKTSNGISLNDVQLKGPMLQDLLIHIVMRFRRYKVPVIADVEKMFRRVRMDDRHWRWQRILWRESPDQPLQVMELRTVTYGMASSSYNAVRALQQCAEDNHPVVQDPERAQRARRAILEDFYMDDLLTSVDTTQQAIELASDVQCILSAGGFRLRKWNSSDPIVLSTITAPDQPREEITINQEEATILGLRWQPAIDILTYKVTALLPNTMPTKRTVISEVAKLYDPTGMLAPVILIAKKLIQELWLAGLHWDAPLPAELCNQWLEFRAALPQLNRIRVPRWLGMHATIKSSLHGFSDASLKAYAAVVYVRTIDENGRIHVALVAAKTKVAPLKQQTVPRLELAAAHLLVKTINNVKTALDVPELPCKLYTDSSIVLGWIRKHPSALKPYVANRVSHIQQHSDPSAWRHIRSGNNPADCASRGLSASQLPNHQLWWTGPPFLHIEPEPPIGSDSALTDEETKILQLEVRTGSISCVATHTAIGLTTRRAVDGVEVSLLERFSSITKLLHTTAYIMRWHPSRKAFWHHHTLTVANLEDALAWHIRMEQERYFSAELRQIRNASAGVSSGDLAPLNPFLDSQGILRVGGRLLAADLSEDQRHPIIIPRASVLTKLLVLQTHRETLHGGVQLTLHTMRRKYWITQARRAIKTCLHNCVVCQRHRKRTMTQQMASLPKHRVCGYRPFAASGVDYCGPFLVRVGGVRTRTVVKTYAAIFVCMATKAVHIELAEDLSAMAFLHVFSRFIGRRGPCKDLYSDNGTAFVGAKRIMQDDLREWHRESNRQHLADGGTNWHFITPSAPHQGGLWEAAVKAAKRHLMRLMGKQTLRYENLQTLLVRIEACLNSRPLIALTDDPEDKMALSPSDFLIGEPLVAIPEPAINCEIPTNRLKQWEYLRRMHQTFWRRWSEEYLATLQTRNKWQTPERSIQVGDIVLIRDENLPPSHWRLGRVITLHPGRDGLTRNVTIRHATGEMQRPVQKLCRLPCGAPNPETTVPAGEDVQESACLLGVDRARVASD